MKTGALPLVTVLAAVAAPFLIVTSPAHAQPGRSKPAARHAEAEDSKLKAGIVLFEAHEYKKATTEFERVYASANEPRALFWIGRALQESGRLAGALRAYKGYLREASPSTVQARGVEVLGNIQTLTMQVALVTIGAPDGSKITVDEVEVGTTPLSEPLYVDPGKHTIGATNGNATASKTVDVAEEERVTLVLLSAERAESARATGDVATPNSEAAPAVKPPASSGVSGLTVGGLGVATLLAAGSVYFSIKAAGSASDFAAKKGELGASRSELDSLQGDARLQAGVAVGLGIGALGLAGFTLLASKKATADKTASLASPSKLIVTGRGVVLAGSF